METDKCIIHGFYSKGRYQAPTRLQIANVDTKLINRERTMYREMGIYRASGSRCGFLELLEVMASRFQLFRLPFSVVNT
jgi:hypothetical protein